MSDSGPAAESVPPDAGQPLPAVESQPPPPATPRDRLAAVLRRSRGALVPALVAASILVGGSALLGQRLTHDTFPAVAAAALRSSTNWSGYAATGGTYTAVNGTWVVPQVAPDGASGASATWVGIGGAGSRDLIQAGTEETESGGRVTHQAWIELLPAASQPVPLAVKGGDTVSVSIASRGGSSWQIAIKNVTTGKSFERTVSYASSFSSAEWIEEAPSSGRRTIALDDFGRVQFLSGSATKDGRTVTIAGSGAQPISMTGPGGQRLATPSGLSADGTAFVVDYSGQTDPGAGQSPGAAPGSQRPRPGRTVPVVPSPRGHFAFGDVIR